jgi:hypothetical protein
LNIFIACAAIDDFRGTYPQTKSHFLGASLGHLPTLASDRFAAASLMQLVDLDPSAMGNYGLFADTGERQQYGSPANCPSL